MNSTTTPCLQQLPVAPQSAVPAIVAREPANLTSSPAALTIVNASPAIWHPCMEALAHCAAAHGIHVVEVFRLTWDQYTQDASQLPPGLVLLCFDLQQVPLHPPGLGRILCKAQAQARHTWVPVFCGAYPLQKLPPALMAAAPAQLDHHSELTDYINILSVYLFLRPHRTPQPQAGPHTPATAPGRQPYHASH